MENREMQTSNTEEMVTISRAEYERFLAREQEQAQTITSLTLQNEWLDQLSLTYNELEAYVFGTKAATEK